MTTSAITTRPATTAEVRLDFKRNGHEVRIDRNGHVEFRPSNESGWLEGRYVEEYWVREEWDGTILARKFVYVR